MPDLPQNQITPAARPVGAFVQPGRVDVAAPAAPQMLPNPQGIRAIGQAGVPSVAGSNQLAELADALAPFSRGLIALGTGGSRLYADREYQRGQEEAARALALANRQVLDSRRQFAAENRKLAAQDPIAGLMMDRVNPFREAGRQNQLSRTASHRVMSAVRAEYDATPGVSEKPLERAGLAQIRARAIEGVVQQFGLDPSSPGFVEHVAPAIGQAEAKLYDLHQDAYIAHQKEMAWRQAADEAYAAWEGARASGSIEFTMYDRATGREIRQSASLAQDPAAFETGVSIVASQIIEGLMDETGIPGETAVLRRKAIERLAQMASVVKGEPAEELLRVVTRLQVGPPDKEGRRATAGSLFGVEILKAQEEVNSITHQTAQRAWQAQQRQLEAGLNEFSDELAKRTIGIPAGPQLMEVVQETVTEFAAKGLPTSDLLEAADKGTKTSLDLQGRFYDSSAAEDFLLEAEQTLGDEWNPGALDQRWKRVRNTAAPEERAKLDQRYLAMRGRKERERDDLPLNLINPLLGDWIKANTARYYAKSFEEAVTRRVNINDFMAWGDANVARSAQLQRQAGLKHIAAALEDARRRKGGALDPGEITSAVSQALASYGKNDKSALQDLFPGSNLTDTPAVGGGSPMPPAPKPGAPRPATYPSFQLDNMPNRSERLRSGGAVLALPSVEAEIERVLGGEMPSPAVRRAARDAGYGADAGRFLVDQHRQYPVPPLPPAARQQVLRRSRGAAGIAGQLQSSAGSRPVDRRGNTFVNAVMGIANAAINPLLGIAPASAASWADRPWVMPRRTPGGGTIGAWARGPAIATAGHQDTGRGFTVPGLRDSKGRPAVFSREAANAFAAMVRDSGGVVRAGDITSSQRSPARNSAVGGAPRSLHLSGHAMDIHGPSLAWVEKNGARYGWHVNRYGGPGDHGGHVEFRGGRGGGSSAGRARSADGAALAGVARRLGVSPADLAAIFSFETGGTLSPAEPGRGAARGRVGLIQAGPEERRTYGIHAGQTFAEQLEGVARYLTDRGVRPGMGLEDIYAAVNGGNVRAGYTPDGNGVVARSAETLRRLREHRASAARKLGLGGGR